MINALRLAARGPVAPCLAIMVLVSLAPIAFAECTDYHLGTPIHINVGNGPLVTAVGDFNHDGMLDIAVSVGHQVHAGGEGYISILLATGPMTYAAPATYLVGDAPRGLVARDFDGDGILDL